MPAGPIRIAGGILLHPLGPRQQALRMRQQRMARRRQRHALATTLHQLRAERRLDVAQPGAGRSQRRMGAARTCRDAAGFGDVPEQAQIVEIGANHLFLRFSRSNPCEDTDFFAKFRAVGFVIRKG